MERFGGRGEVVDEVQLVAGLESMGLWMMCVVRICDMRHDGHVLPLSLRKVGGWLKLHTVQVFSWQVRELYQRKG